jgi:tetratricopeptide (TPR) repeat protein
VNRRELLRILSTAGALMAGGPAGWDCLGPGAHSGQPSPARLDELADLNAHLWRVFALARSKRLVYPLVRDHLSVITGCLQRPATEAGYRRLCALASDTFQLAGEILFDGSRYTDAAHCYTLAATAAREASSPDLWACALTRHAFIGVYEGTPGGSVGMLDAAGSLAHHGDRSLSTRYWVAAVQAEAYAGIGDLSACERALARAEEVQGLDGQVHNGGWLRFDGSRLAEERGTCYAALGRSDLAEAALLSALAGNLSARRRGTVLTSLAMTGVQRGDLDQAQHHASAAIGIAQETGSGVIMRKLAELHDALAAFGGDQQAQGIRDEITAMTRA